jgi:prepilin-type N-terminal cleavage/methylation domain-containing protein
MRRVTSHTGQGFTLLEILIAMTILFSVAAAALAAYQGVNISTQRAADVTRNLTWLNPLTDHIRQQLQQSEQAELNGEGELAGVRFNWIARLHEQAPPPARFEAESGAFIEYAPRYRLYRVELNVQYDGKPRTYQFMELVWALAAVPNQASR